MNFLSRDYSTPIKRLQHSYKFPIISYKSLINLLSRNHKTPIKRSSESYQEITAKHNKMLEYLDFFLLCSIFALTLYLYIRIKKYFPILKMAEELIGNLGYEIPQSDTKHQKLLECVLTGNSKLYLGKLYTLEKIKELNKEEVEKLFNN